MKTIAKILSIFIISLLAMGFIFGPSNLKRGRKHLENGEYSQALAVLTDALNEDPDNPEIHRDLGIAYYRTKQYEQALMELNKAKEGLKKDGQVIFYLGMTYERIEQYDKAIEEYSNYVKLGRFSSIKKKIQQRAQWLVQKQMEQWAKNRMMIEQGIDPAEIPPNTIGITYFKPFSVSEELEPLHKGLTDLLIIDLSMVESLRVLERIKLREIYNELGLGSTDVVDESTAPRMGKLLGASTIVTGSFTGFGKDQWRIDPALGKAALGKLQVLGGIEGSIANFLQTEKELVLEILRNLGIEVTQKEREKILQNIPTKSLEAFLAYCRGLDYYDKGMFGEAANAFEEAISIDPNFDQARSNMAETILLQQPMGGVDELESAWDSAIITQAGKDMLLTATVDSMANDGANRVPGSELGSGGGVSEIELEVLIQW